MKRSCLAILLVLAGALSAQADDLQKFKFVSSAEGTFEFNSESSVAKVWPTLKNPKQEELCKFSGLVTESTKITLVEDTPVCKEVIPAQLGSISGKRVVAFGTFTQVQRNGKILSLHIDHLIIVVLPEQTPTKGGWR